MEEPEINLNNLSNLLSKYNYRKIISIVIRLIKQSWTQVLASPRFDNLVIDTISSYSNVQVVVAQMYYMLKKLYMPLGMKQFMQLFGIKHVNKIGITSSGLNLHYAANLVDQILEFPVEEPDTMINNSIKNRIQINNIHAILDNNTTNAYFMDPDAPKLKQIFKIQHEYKRTNSPDYLKSRRKYHIVQDIHNEILNRKLEITDKRKWIYHISEFKVNQFIHEAKKVKKRKIYGIIYTNPKINLGRILLERKCNYIVIAPGIIPSDLHNAHGYKSCHLSHMIISNFRNIEELANFHNTYITKINDAPILGEILRYKEEVFGIHVTSLVENKSNFIRFNFKETIDEINAKLAKPPQIVPIQSYINGDFLEIKIQNLK